jgi:hypothetical protein
MSIQWKSTFIIIATLVIGILIGVFLAGPVMHRRVARRVMDRGPEMFTQMMERVIEPTPDQEEAVRSVLEEHSSRLEELHEDFRTEMVTTMDSLKADLDPILNDEQKARLEERHHRLERFMERGPGHRMKGKPGPPGHRPGQEPPERERGPAGD